LSHELGQDISLVAIIQQLLIEIERLYLSLPAGESIYEEWRDSLVTLGKRVQIKSAGRVYAGLAETVARDGSLLLRQSDGSLINISAGDVNHQN
jgi:biotin-(acetyl-CoA carboxylase) ligase